MIKVNFPLYYRHDALGCRIQRVFIKYGDISILTYLQASDSILHLQRFSRIDSDHLKNFLFRNIIVFQHFLLPENR